MSILHRVKSLFSAQKDQTVIECYRTTRQPAVGKTSVKEWRWRAVAANGKILADSAEGYARRLDMLEIVRRLFPDRPAFPIVIENS